MKFRLNWHVSASSTREVSHVTGEVQVKESSFYDPALEFILKKRLVSTSLLALARSS